MEFQISLIRLSFTIAFWNLVCAVICLGCLKHFFLNCTFSSGMSYGCVWKKLKNIRWQWTECRNALCEQRSKAFIIVSLDSLLNAYLTYRRIQFQEQMNYYNFITIRNIGCTRNINALIPVHSRIRRFVCFWMCNLNGMRLVQNCVHCT